MGGIPLLPGPANRTDLPPSGARLGEQSPTPTGGAGAGSSNATAAGGHSPDFIVHPNGETIIVPSGATGPNPARGDGIQFTGGSGGHGLDPRVTDVRIMDPVTKGKYQYPNGYVSYSNASGQAVDPFTGKTVSKTDPMWHIPFS